MFFNGIILCYCIIFVTVWLFVEDWLRRKLWKFYDGLSIIFGIFGEFLWILDVYSLSYELLSEVSCSYAKTIDWSGGGIDLCFVLWTLLDRLAVKFV